MNFVLNAQQIVDLADRLVVNRDQILLHLLVDHKRALEKREWKTRESSEDALHAVGRLENEVMVFDSFVGFRRIVGFHREFLFSLQLKTNLSALDDLFVQLCGLLDLNSGVVASDVVEHRLAHVLKLFLLDGQHKALVADLFSFWLDVKIELFELWSSLNLSIVNAKVSTGWVNQHLGFVCEASSKAHSEVELPVLQLVAEGLLYLDRPHLQEVEIVLIHS